ncbi:MAG: hypothetical protein KDA84_00155, partial [Planctomycetaceae bacterium]|nr:hypothetical protein [Planctomycetaceae bacterium]
MESNLVLNRHTFSCEEQREHQQERRLFDERLDPAEFIEEGQAKNSLPAGFPVASFRKEQVLAI